MLNIFNSTTQFVFTQLRNAIPVKVDYGRGALPTLDFSKTSSLLFFDVKANPLRHYWAIKALKKLLDIVPYLKEDTTPFSDDFYYELTGDKSYPVNYQKSTSPLDCFLKNAPALCKHTSDTEAELDLNYLSKYSVQKELPRYGGKAFLKIVNGIYKIIRVEYSPIGTNNIDNKTTQEEAQHIFLSSFAVHVVFARHAVMTHLSVSQRILNKFLAPEREELVSKNLRLKTLLQILTTRVNEVSTNELLLIGSNGLLDRTCTFASNALESAGKDLYEYYANMKPQELVDLLGDGSPQWKSAVNDGIRAAQTLITELELNISREEEELFALDVWVSSFYHQFIGDLQIDNLIKGNLPFPCTGKAHEQIKSYATQSTTIAATTMTRMYSVKQVPELITDTQSQVAWAKYSLTLDSIKTGIDALDSKNAYAAVNF